MSFLADRLHFRAGFSLIESVYASFILLVSVLLTFQLFHLGLQYFRWTQERTTATQLATRRLAQVRNWSKIQTDWTGFPTGPEPDFPDFNITTSLASQPITSPCSHFPQKGASTTECKLVTVTVSWTRSSISLVSLVSSRGDLEWRAANPIVISGAIPPVVTSTTAVNLSAEAFGQKVSNGGLKLEGLFFSWYVEPVGPTGAMATITPAPDGRTAILINQTRLADGSMVASTGQCRVTVRATYNGAERMAQTAVIGLAP